MDSQARSERWSGAQQLCVTGEMGGRMGVKGGIEGQAGADEMAVEPAGGGPGRSAGRRNQPGRRGYPTGVS